MLVTTSLFTVLPILALIAASDAFVIPGGGNRIHPLASYSTITTTTTTTTTLHMGLLNRFRKKRETITVNQIREGEPLPEIDVEVVVNAASMGDGETTTATIREIVGGPGTNLLIGMPGAYTPKCSEEHMPGYIKASDKLKKLGVNNIAVVTTNDKFVNGAWAKDLGIRAPVEDKTTAPPITILADGDGDLVQQLGLVEDMGYGIGVRSKRFVMILEDGVVRRVEVDEGMDQCEKTRADNIVKILTPEVASMEESDINVGALAGVCVVILAGLALSMWGDDGGTASTKAASEGFNLLQQFGN